MGLRTKLKDSEESLIRIIDAFTYVYIVSVFTFASTIDQGAWLHNTSNAIALFYLGLLFCYALLHPQALNSKFSVLYLPFLILCGVSYFWTLDKARCLKVTVELTAMWVLCTLMFNYFYLEHKYEMLIKAFYLGGFCICFATVQCYGIEAYIKGIVEGVRMGHMIVNVNRLGMSGTYAGLIALYYCIYKKKWLNIFPAIFMFGVAYFSLSRKVLLQIILGIFLLVFFSGNWKRKIFAIIIAVGLLAVFSYVPIFSAALARFGQMVEAEDGSTKIRVKLIKLGLDQFQKTPLLGVGLGGGRVLNRQLLNFHSYSHCNYIELLTDLGAVGLLLYYFHYLFTVIPFIKHSFAKEKGISCLMLTFMMLQMILHVGVVEYHQRFTIILVMIFYLITSELKRKDE